jgi:hypothetical protein
VAEIVEEISSSEYAIDSNVSRLTWMPALIKLAHTGLGCLSIPDVLHLSHDLAKGYALALFGRLRQAKRGLAQAKQRLGV